MGELRRGGKKGEGMDVWGDTQVGKIREEAIPKKVNLPIRWEREDTLERGGRCARSGGT